MSDDALSGFSLSAFEHDGMIRQAHAQSGGTGVGAIGMCFTGSFALAMAIDDVVLAPVMSQPALPVARAGLGVGPAELETIKALPPKAFA